MRYSKEKQQEKQQKSICEGVNYYYYYLTLGASPSPAPPDRERGKLLAAENRKKIRQAARRLDKSR